MSEFQSTSREYRARHTGWVAGRMVSAGDTLWLCPRAARYEPVDPVPLPQQPTAAPAADAEPQPVPRRSRKEGQS